MENLKVDSAWHFSSSLYKNYFFGFSTCPISRPSISPFQPSLRGINELTRSSTRNWNSKIWAPLSSFGSAKRVDLAPRENRCKISKESVARLHRSLPSFIPKDASKISRALSSKPTLPFFLSFLLPFHPERNSRPTSLKRREPVVLSFRSVEKEKRKREKKKKKMSSWHTYTARFIITMA